MHQTHTFYQWNRKDQALSRCLTVQYDIYFSGCSIQSDVCLGAQISPSSRKSMCSWQFGKSDVIPKLDTQICELCDTQIPHHCLLSTSIPLQVFNHVAKSSSSWPLQYGTMKHKSTEPQLHKHLMWNKCCLLASWASLESITLSKSTIGDRSAGFSFRNFGVLLPYLLICGSL